MLNNRTDRNKIRKVIMDAEDGEVITKDEAGFVVSLVEKLRVEIENKVKQLHDLQGEISLLQRNEKTIIDLIENMVAAAERDLARRETMNKLKAAKGVQEDCGKASKGEISEANADTVDDKTKQDM